MPLYEDQCDACGQRFELIQKFSDGAARGVPEVRQGPGAAAAVVAGDSISRAAAGTSPTTHARAARRKGTARKARAKKAEGDDEGRGHEEGRRGRQVVERRQPAADSKKADSTPAPHRSRQAGGKLTARAALRAFSRRRRRTFTSSVSRYRLNGSARSGRRSAK